MKGPFRNLFCQLLLSFLFNRKKHKPTHIICSLSHVTCAHYDRQNEQEKGAKIVQLRSSFTVWFIHMTSNAKEKFNKTIGRWRLLAQDGQNLTADLTMASENAWRPQSASDAVQSAPQVAVHSIDILPSFEWSSVHRQTRMYTFVYLVQHRKSIFQSCTGLQLHSFGRAQKVYIAEEHIQICVFSLCKYIHMHFSFS